MGEWHRSDLEHDVAMLLESMGRVERCLDIILKILVPQPRPTVAPDMTRSIGTCIHGIALRLNCDECEAAPRDMQEVEG